MIKSLSLSVLLILTVLIITGPTAQMVFYQSVTAQGSNSYESSTSNFDMNSIFNNLQNSFLNPIGGLNSDNAKVQGSNSYESSTSNFDMNSIFNNLQNSFTDPLGQVDITFPPGPTDSMAPVNQPSSTDSMVPVNQPSSTDSMVPVNQPSSTDSMVL